MRIIKKKLDRRAADSRLLPKTEKYEAVHYMLNEWDALMNIFTRGDYHLDNNLVERLNSYISLNIYPMSSTKQQHCRQEHR